MIIFGYSYFIYKSLAFLILVVTHPVLITVVIGLAIILGLIKGTKDINNIKR